MNLIINNIKIFKTRKINFNKKGVGFMSINKLYKIYSIIHNLTIKQAKKEFKIQNIYKNFNDYFLFEVHGYGFILNFKENGEIKHHIHINEKQYLSPKEFKNIIKKYSINNNTSVDFTWS